MPLLARLLSLRDTLFHKERLERDLDAEIRAAMADLTDRYAAEGLDPASARREAARTFGGVAHVKEAVRDGRIGAGLDSWLSDLRYAARGVRKSPGFTGVILLTLALGIGANTAIFSVVRAMLIRPLPYPEADRLVFIWLGRNAVGYRGPLSGPDLRDLRQGTTTFAGFGGIWASSAISLTGGGVEPEQLRAALVTTNFFDILGVAPALGRTFRSEDSLPGAEQSVVLGWELFQRRFGGDPSIVGRQIDVNEGHARVVGVMSKDFRLLLPGDSSVPDRLQAFAPFWPDLESGPRGSLFLRVVGRMRPGVTVAAASEDVAAASEDVSAVARRIGAELGRNRQFTTIGLHDDDVRELRGPLMALFAGVGILLLIACVNVASLLIARAATRAREISLRLALGAGRGRLVRLFLVEGLLLTLLASIFGTLAGYAGLRVLLARVPETLSRLDTTRIDGTVLAFTLGISVVAALLFSVAPPGELFRPSSVERSLQPELRTSTPHRSHRTRAALVTLQIALSAMLLVGAGLFVRAFVEIVRVDPGFRTDRQLTFRLAIPERYDSRETFNAFAGDLQQRLAALPGVSRVGTMSHLPYDDMPNWSLMYGSNPPLPTDAQSADSRAISTGLFESLDVKLVDGRFFTDGDDDPQHPVAIVDDRLARDLWPGQSAIGQTFATTVAGMAAPIEGPAKLSVVGVVPHLRLRSLVEDFRPQIFVPWRIAQRNPTAYVIDTTRDPSALVSEIRRTVAVVDPRVAVYDVRPMQTYVEQARSMRRFTMVLATLFAILALTLTLVGVYGVLAYAVAHRRHEIGVRRAVGASTAHVMTDILREGLGLAIVGCGLGLGVAAAGAQLLQSQLYGVHPRDPVTYGVTFLVIVTTAALACWIPARRATRIGPMDALRAG